MKKCILLAAALLLLIMPSAFADEIVSMPTWVSGALTFPDAVVKIESEAFYGDTSISDVSIPMGVQSIGQNAFTGCTGISRVVIFNPDLVFSANALGTAEEKKTIYGLKGSTAQSYANSYGYDFVALLTRTEADLAKKQALLEYAGSHATRTPPTSYSKYDCVTFVRHCYINATYNGARLNVVLPDTCPEMYRLDQQPEAKKLNIMKITSVSDLQPGDVICWTDDKYWRNSGSPEPGEANYKKCSHVGMYAADSLNISGFRGTHVFVESSSSAGHVRYHSFDDSYNGSYYRRNFLCGWRILL